MEVRKAWNHRVLQGVMGSHGSCPCASHAAARHGAELQRTGRGSRKSDCKMQANRSSVRQGLCRQGSWSYREKHFGRLPGRSSRRSIRSACMPRRSGGRLAQGHKNFVEKTVLVRQALDGSRKAGNCTTCFCALDGHACCCSDRPAASSLSAGNCTHAQCTSHAGERNTEVLVQAAIQQRKRPLHAPGLARSRTADIRSIKSSEQERVLLCEPTSPLGLCDLFLLVLHFLLLRTSADLRRCYSST